MNGPNFNLDTQGGNGRLPTVANGPRSVAQAPYGEFVNFNVPDASGPDYRKLFFTYLGLALKYRWLVVACCTLALAIGFVLTYTQTPIYQAVVIIQIDKQAARVVKAEDVQDPDSATDTTRFYATQYDLLRSRSLAERVAADLDLATAADFLHPVSTSAWARLRSLIRSAVSKTQDTVTKAQDKATLEDRKSAAASM